MRAATRSGRRFANSVHVERVMSHIDAAEAFILRAAPRDHVAAQVPAILDHVRSHLGKDNVQREQADAIGAAMRAQGKTKLRNDVHLTERERRTLVAAFRAASEEERHEIMRVRSFRNVLIVSGLLVGLLGNTPRIPGCDLLPERRRLLQPGRDGRRRQDRLSPQ